MVGGLKVNKFQLIEEAARFETSQLKRDELIYFVESVKMHEMMEQARKWVEDRPQMRSSLQNSNISSGGNFQVPQKKNSLPDRVPVSLKK